MYQIWQEYALDELRSYSENYRLLQSINQQIAEIEVSMSGVNGFDPSRVHVCSSMSSKEDGYINAISRKDSLQKETDLIRVAITRIDKALGVLSADERMILDRLYIHREKGAAIRLADDMGVMEKTIYLWKNVAIQKFTVAMFGII